MDRLERARERDDLRQALLERLESVLPNLFPNGKRSKDSFKLGNVHGAAGRSLEVELTGERAGLWLDRATGESGDVFDLIAAAYHLDTKRDFREVVQIANSLIGRTPSVPPAQHAARSAALPSTAAVAHSKQSPMDELGPPTARWDYHNAVGDLIACVYRYDPPGQKKEFRPWDVVKRRWAPPEPRPLYNQPALAEADLVILVEGEKCAAALIQAGFTATTAMHGANAPVDKTDWTPLAGKTVLVWPDHDRPGWDYATAAGYAALEHGAVAVSVLIPPEGEAEGWDAADALQAGFDVHQFTTHGPRMALNREECEPDLVPEQSIPGSEDALALAFTRAYARDWQYVALWGKWLVWDGRCWRTELTLQASDLIRHVCREAAMALDSERAASKLVGSSTVAGVERLARSDRRHAATADEWDADPWLVNTPGGVVDLKTGGIKPHRREDRMTRVTEATPIRGSACPTWRQFLIDVTDGSEELMAYLQRVAGYCLTGVTSEHALFFLYGTGANGKSVFVNTLATLMGGYSTNAPMDTFMETRSDRHPTDMAGLRGARFVSSVETEQGRRWAESKIKALTGGDKVTARFMRQDFFDYVPQFKLVIAGNHKPLIRNVDEAMKRRLHLIPFTKTVPPEKRDKNLSAKLLAERDGIMAWAVEGCLRWQKTGLKPPKIVVDATEEYFEEEDSVGEFLDEECHVSPVAREGISALYERWRERAEQRGEYVGTSRWLTQQLLTRGFERLRLPGGAKALSGLSLKPKQLSGYTPYNDD